MSDHEMRNCNKCHQPKLTSDFYSKGVGRVESICKRCSKSNRVRLYKVRTAKEKRLKDSTKWTLVPVIQSIFLKLEGKK